MESAAWGPAPTSECCRSQGAASVPEAEICLLLLFIGQQWVSEE